MYFKGVSPLSLTVIAGLLLTGGIGCSKSNNVNDGGTPEGITAKINGTSFKAFQTAAGLYTYYYQVGGAGSINGDSVFLTIYLATPITLNQQVSTDDNGFAEIDYVMRINNAPFAGYTASHDLKGPAYYTVTGIDTVKHMIQGTFMGTLAGNGLADGAPDSVVITNGTFNTTYQ